MPVRGHQPILIDQFNGRFNRGQLFPLVSYVGSEPTLKDHFVDELNLSYTFQGAGTREGLLPGGLVFTGLGNVTRFHLYKVDGQATRYIMLSNDGVNSYFYDSTNMASPIFTYLAQIITDFALVNMYGRCYLSPHNRSVGIAGLFLLVYDGTTCRQAGGQPGIASGITAIPHDPTKTDYDGQGNGGLPTTGDNGNVAQGVRLFAYCFETASGYITGPGPNSGAFPNLTPTPFVYTAADSTHKVDIYGVPTGPTGTVARRIICTPLLTTGAYDGKAQDYQWFFAPNGRIPNNSIIGSLATPAITLNFFDTDLAFSAQYLFTQLSNIPAGVALHKYSNRLVVAGQNANSAINLISQDQQPESFDAVNGNIIVDPSDSAGGVRNLATYSGTLYSYKSQRTYYCTDPKDGVTPPISWLVNDSDFGVGTECFGIETVLDAKGQHASRILIADRAGLLQFAGVFAQKPITWNVDDVWKRITKSAFQSIQVVDDPTLFRVYVSLPLDGAASPNAILMGDYSQGQQSSPFMATGGITPEIIKWSLWNFPSNPTSIAIDVDPNTKQTYFLVLQGNTIYTLSPVTNPARNDYGNAINSFALFAPQSVDKEESINHFAEIRFRGYGSGTLILSIINEDNTLTFACPSIALTIQPTADLRRPINFVNERALPKIAVAGNLGDWFHVNLVTLYAKPLYMSRPA